MTAGAADDRLEIAGEWIPRGTVRELQLPLTQSFSGIDVAIPVRVIRGPRPGPVLMLTAAVHGDELNGTGIIREIALQPTEEVEAGTLVLVPVVNILGFERGSRYMPDRRDLNRSFPGEPGGSMTRRVAHTLFHQLVTRCDYLVDFHTAAVRRTNYPNVRGDLSKPEIIRLARAFGCQLVVDHAGTEGTLRRTASNHGVAAIIVEAGEVLKVEPSVLEIGVRGVRNVMVELGMVQGEPARPAYQARVLRSRWLRVDTGGMLRFHVAPGDVVEQGQPIAVCTTLLGGDRSVITAPEDGVVMGLTTSPLVKPGDPVCHLALPEKGIARIRQALSNVAKDSLHERLKGDLASSVTVGQADEDDWT